MKLYQAMASKLQAIENCLKSNNTEWLEKHQESLEELVKYNLPSGSGIDSGNTLDFENSDPNRLIIESSYHAMDEYGGYCGWFDYRVVVTPSLASNINLEIDGSFDGEGGESLHEYLHSRYYDALCKEV